MSDLPPFFSQVDMSEEPAKGTFEWNSVIRVGVCNPHCTSETSVILTYPLMSFFLLFEYDE